MSDLKKDMMAEARKLFKTAPKANESKKCRWEMIVPKVSFGTKSVYRKLPETNESLIGIETLSDLKKIKK